MEQTLHELNVDGLNMKLTNEKLFINSAASSETFALRSISGIGTVDLLEKYNQELQFYKAQTRKPWVWIVILGFIGVANLLSWFLNVDSDKNIRAFLGLIFTAIALFLYFKEPKISEPSLKSAVRLMISGATRDFVFDKKGQNSSEVSKFVALVEDTLTSYHKN